MEGGASISNPDIFPSSLSFYGGVAYGSSDQLMARWSRATGSGPLMLIHQGVVTASQDAGTHFRQGAEVVLHSPDLGKSWSYSNVLDPCAVVDTADAHPGCDTASQGGFDYPNIALDPLNDGTVYLEARVTGGGATKNALMKSDDYGHSWNFLAYLPGAGAAAGTGEARLAVVGDRLFILRDYCSASGDIALYWYQGGTIYPSTSPCASGSAAIIPSAQWGANIYHAAHPIISGIGQFGSNYYVRIAYPYLPDGTGTDRQWYHILVVKNDGLRNSVVAESDVSPTLDDGSANASGSALMAQFANVERTTEMPADAQTNVSLLWWYESGSTPSPSTPPPTAWSNTTIKACVLRDLDPTCTPLRLAIRNGATRKWTFNSPTGGGDSAHSIPGDYVDVPFYYDQTEPSGRRIKFLVTWMEPSGATEVHTNVVSVTP